MMDLEVRCQRAPWNEGVEVVVFDRQGSPRAVSTARVEFSPITEGQDVEPTLKLSTSSAQRLMDELWSCGLRPTEGTGSAGSLAATERHLKDMQRVAFAFLDREVAP